MYECSNTDFDFLQIWLLHYGYTFLSGLYLQSDVRRCRLLLRTGCNFSPHFALCKGSVTFFHAKEMLKVETVYEALKRRLEANQI